MKMMKKNGINPKKATRSEDGKLEIKDTPNLKLHSLMLQAEELGLDLVEISKKKTICKRCHGLQNFGEVSESLRPGWTEEPALSQEKIRNLLLTLREKPAVIIALVDLFDFAGSILPELDAIAGENPVIIAAMITQPMSNELRINIAAIPPSTYVKQGIPVPLPIRNIDTPSCRNQQNRFNCQSFTATAIITLRFVHTSCHKYA